MAIYDSLAAGYREEATERIAELEATLLALDDRPDDAELVDQAFRALHTIKGSGAMFGFEVLAAFTHEVETVFDAVRAGRAPVTRALVSATLEAKDLIRELLDGADPGPERRTELVAKLHRALPPAQAQAQAPAAPTPESAPAAPAEGARTYRIRFDPDPGLFADGTNPLGVLAELRSLGRCEIVAGPTAVPTLEELEPERCYLSWNVFLSTARGRDAIRDAFMFVEDRSSVRIEEVAELPEGAADLRLGEILVERGELSGEALGRALAEKKRIGDLLAEKGLVTPAAVLAAVAEQGFVREERQRRERAAPPAAASIRVEAAKLDRLVDLVGELVIAQARLARLAASREDPELNLVSEDVDRLSGELRDRALDMRMVPIGTTFGRFQRLVRDLSTELGKDITFASEGAETELDKTVIERLGDPLVHLIRNSCDHGIEPRERRRAAGKPEQGTVRLSASHAGASVLIEIHDDGGGIDPAAVRAKAVERGLLSPDARPSDRELFNLIFLPGFSTARSVSSVSGRGVGMDVVKSAIEALRGTVSIESAAGAGTTIRIHLPLTLAIIEGLLVSVGDGSYVLPLSAVEECVELSREDVERGHGAHLATVRGELVPYVRLRELFEVAGDRPDLEQIAIVHHAGERCGLVVDGVVGQHQTVIKSMGRMYRDVMGLSGATILGDGSVALIVDVPALVQCGLMAPPSSTPPRSAMEKS
jgi:two-component system chemotaxis sensor kinase CheA